MKSTPFSVSATIYVKFITVRCWDYMPIVYLNGRCAHIAPIHTIQSSVDYGPRAETSSVVWLLPIYLSENQKGNNSRTACWRMRFDVDA